MSTGLANIQLSALRRAVFIANMSPRNAAYDCVAWSGGVHTTKRGAWRMVRGGQDAASQRVAPRPRP